MRRRQRQSRRRRKGVPAPPSGGKIVSRREPKAKDNVSHEICGGWCCAAGSFFVLFRPVTVIDSLGRGRGSVLRAAERVRVRAINTALRESLFLPAVRTTRSGDTLTDLSARDARARPGSGSASVAHAGRGAAGERGQPVAVHQAQGHSLSFVDVAYGNRTSSFFLSLCMVADS